MLLGVVLVPQDIHPTLFFPTNLAHNVLLRIPVCIDTHSLLPALRTPLRTDKDCWHSDPSPFYPRTGVLYSQWCSGTWSRPLSPAQSPRSVRCADMESCHRHGGNRAHLKEKEVKIKVKWVQIKKVKGLKIKDWDKESLKTSSISKNS